MLAGLTPRGMLFRCAIKDQVNAVTHWPEKLVLTFSKSRLARSTANDALTDAMAHFSDDGDITRGKQGVVSSFRELCDYVLDEWDSAVVTKNVILEEGCTT
jgi:hypothetical protein